MLTGTPSTLTSYLVDRAYCLLQSDITMATGKSTLSKEAKTALKAAKEAIKNKEYKEAIKHCKVQYDVLQFTS